MTLLENLWYGNIDLHEAILTDSKRYKHFLSLMGRNRDELNETLNGKQPETLEKYDHTVCEIHSTAGSRSVLLRFSSWSETDDRSGRFKGRSITCSGEILFLAAVLSLYSCKTVMLGNYLIFSVFLVCLSSDMQIGRLSSRTKTSATNANMFLPIRTIMGWA